MSITIKYQTYPEILQHWAKKTPDQPALLAPGRMPLSYHDLAELETRSRAAFASHGLRPNDPVAIVLPNGPEMAAVFLALAGLATAAPLNPSYQEAEFAFYLEDLQARALVVLRGQESPARAVAARLGIPLIEIEADLESGAGSFHLSGAFDLPSRVPAAKPQDVALILHTSGTTSRPKIVPLQVQNLMASAANIAETLALSPSDRCLNVMPLFHIHGLMAALSASLYAGGSVICSPGFYATEFFEWLRTLHPTWYTAVPTMHQSIVARASQQGDSLDGVSLRLVRSSSSSLPPTVMQALETLFNCPVVEAYGMTEAAHQMASNPIGPGRQKPGSVGLAAGPEMAIMDESSPRLLPRGATGEIVIRGPNVTSGYQNNPKANASAFTDGWFRTGDQGRQDEEGYFYITGRLKEIINRGGEKISPREVDEALLAHPLVAQAVTFAMPDPRLGEEIAAAVVLKNRSIDESELRRHAASRLADFKVPRRIVILDEIPKGATGKVQRIGLAEKLGLDKPASTSPRPYAAPTNLIETTLCEIWKQVLKVPQVGIDDPFLELGGDSLLAAVLVTAVSEKMGILVTVTDFVETPTVREQARVLASRLAGGPSESAAVQGHHRLTMLNPSGTRRPFFLMSASSSDAFIFPGLAEGLGGERPLYGLTPSTRRIEPETAALEQLADEYLEQVRRLQPQGPYLLGGNCSGGILAYQTARRLIAAGETVDLLVLTETYGLGYPPDSLVARVLRGFYVLRKHIDVLSVSSPSARQGYLQTLWERNLGRALPGAARSNAVAYHFRPQPDTPGYPGPVLLLRASHQPYGVQSDPTLGWNSLVEPGKLETQVIPGYHGGLYPGPRASAIGRLIATAIAKQESPA